MLKYLLLGVVCIFIGCNMYYTKYDGTSGYSDLLYNKTIEVTYIGSNDMTVTDAKKYALYRIAHVAFLENASFFRLVKDNSDVKTSCRHQCPTQSPLKIIDSAGVQKAAALATPGIESPENRPTVTLVAEIVEKDGTGDCISVLSIIKQAESAGITIKR